jgi:hypothetical protein
MAKTPRQLEKYVSLQGMVLRSKEKQREIERSVTESKGCDEKRIGGDRKNK